MSKNVFDKIQDVTTNVNKNTFDWSHANNFTGKIGKIMPIFCEQLPAGSSIRIKPTFALKFMPMMFPIQTRLKAYLLSSVCLFVRCGRIMPTLSAVLIVIHRWLHLIFLQLVRVWIN